MITLEMFALFSPHKFKIDPYQILVQRGGGLFQSFVLPDGRATSEYDNISQLVQG